MLENTIANQLLIGLVEYAASIGKKCEIFKNDIILNEQGIDVLILYGDTIFYRREDDIAGACKISDPNCIEYVKKSIRDFC